MGTWRRSVAGALSGCLSVGLGAAGCRLFVGFAEPSPLLDAGATHAGDALDAADGRFDASPTACGLPYSTPACASCIQGNCCPESSACAGDPSCAGLLVCFGGCVMGDYPCQSQCVHDNPPWNSLEQSPLEACSVAKCATECGFECGNLGPVWALPDAAAACQSCLAMMDCDNVRACLSSLDCVASSNCAASTPSTNYACWDAGIPLVQDLGACKAACGLGSNWSCVGNVQWPRATSGPVTLSSGTVVDYVMNSKPLDGVTVSACVYQDSSCGSPLAQARTDTNGNAQLDVPAVGRASFGLEASSYLQANLQPYATSLLFWGPPVSVPQFGPTTFIPMFTPDEAQSLFMAHGVTWDYQARGVVLFSVPDCSRPGAGLASGVQVTLEGGMSDPAVRRWYGRTSFDFNATETSDGAGGFVNVLPGAVTVAATPVAIGRPSSKVPIWVRADTVTVVFLVPTP